MSRLTAVVAVPLLLLAACSKGQEIATIEEAEAYAQARGVVLTEKKENREQMVAARAFQYMTPTGAHVSVLQFNTTKAAQAWKQALDDTPLGQEARILKGPVVFSIWGDSDAATQKIVAALK